MYLGAGSVHHFLCGSVCMNCGHQTLQNAKVIIDNLSQGSQTVGRTGSIAASHKLTLYLSQLAAFEGNVRFG